MIDEQKVRLMTKIAVFEEKEENSELIMSKYFLKDYVKFHCLTTLLSSTFCYWIIVAAYVFINFDNILSELNLEDYFDVIAQLMKWYVIFCGVFFIIGFIVYTIRFMVARKDILAYNKNLTRLYNYLDDEEMRDNRGTVGNSFGDDTYDMGEDK
ncbi:MAG: hypothetical protein K6E28_08590 [Eubacterium sp.]|nr:hypothetical protein [Eubacterium sp.]